MFTALVLYTIPAVALCLVIWAVYEAMLRPAPRRRLRRDSSRRQPRTIRATYGPGYGLLQWQEEDWDTQPKESK